jgi:pimeloyl-ACP methyl ester carboxylesterase
MGGYNRPIKGELTVDRFVIPYRVYENHGPHIVCLNGVQQSMAMWSSFLARFASNYRILVFDFPNQGKGLVLSGSAKISLDEQTGIVHEVMKAARVNKEATLCAASWGGVVAIVFAIKYPDAVRRLILASLGTRPNKNMVQTIQRAFEIDAANRNQMAETLINSFGHDLSPSVKKKISRQFLTMSREQLNAFYEHGLFVMSTKTITDLVNLRDIRIKTTLIIGEKDTIIDLEDVRFLALQIPNAEIKEVKNVGHFLHLEREEVLDIYEDILSTTDISANR